MNQAVEESYRVRCRHSIRMKEDRFVPYLLAPQTETRAMALLVRCSMWTLHFNIQNFHMVCVRDGAAQWLEVGLVRPCLHGASTACIDTC